MELGNSLTATHPVEFQTPERNGFNLGWSYLDPHLSSSSNQNRLYKVLKPLTSLYYIQGPTELIHIQAVHSQNIKPNWNFGVEYRRQLEDGFYFSQNTGVYNTRAFTWFHTRDLRYHLIAEAVWNRLENQESGGIFSRASFDTLNGPVRKPLVRYSSRFANNEAVNILRSNTYSLTQIYRSGRSVFFPSEQTDSLGRAIPDTVATLIPVSQFRLHTSYGWYRNIFTVNTLEDLEFTSFYLDSMATYDSLSMQKAEVELAWESGQYAGIDDSFHVDKRKLAWSASMRYEGIKVGWLKDFAQYNNLSAQARLGSNPYNHSDLQWALNGYFAFSGYNAGDMELKAHLAKQFGAHRLSVSALSKRYAPAFNQFYYFGNHDFWWNQGFEKQGAQDLSASYGWKGLAKFTASYKRLNNYIYQEEAPKQLNGSFDLVQLKLNTNLNWGVLHWQLEALYQTEGITELPLPQFSTRQSVYAQGFMFKKALLAKLGLDFYYVTSYRAPVYYAPARMWRLQNAQEDFLVGNYPYFNVYFTGKIQTVTFFLMMQHVTANLFGSGYYSSPYYPMQPRAFRFGIKWTLFE